MFHASGSRRFQALGGAGALERRYHGNGKIHGKISTLWCFWMEKWIVFPEDLGFSLVKYRRVNCDTQGFVRSSAIGHLSNPEIYLKSIIKPSDWSYSITNLATIINSNLPCANITMFHHFGEPQHVYWHLEARLEETTSIPGILQFGTVLQVTRQARLSEENGSESRKSHNYCSITIITIILI